MPDTNSPSTPNNDRYLQYVLPPSPPPPSLPCTLHTYVVHSSVVSLMCKSRVGKDQLLFPPLCHPMPTRGKDARVWPVPRPSTKVPSRYGVSTTLPLLARARVGCQFHLANYGAEESALRGGFPGDLAITVRPHGEDTYPYVFVLSCGQPNTPSMLSPNHHRPSHLGLAMCSDPPKIVSDDVILHISLFIATFSTFLFIPTRLGFSDIASNKSLEKYL